MTSPEPVWRVKTRPCPFYQRGGCIFAANCNFLHAAPKKRKDSGYDSDSSCRSLKSPEPMGRPQTPLKNPVVVVDSPCSTPREPHMARLLSALSPVIGDEDSYIDAATLVEPDSAVWSESLPTLTHGEDSEFFARVTETMAEMMEVTSRNDEDQDNTVLEYLDDEPYDFSDSFFSKPPASDLGSCSRSSSISLHSPSDDTLRLPFGSRDSSDTPSIHTTHSSPGVEQILEMPAIPDNHDDLLSPVDLSHLQLNNFSILHADTWKDTSSIDSSFAESAKSSLSHIMSPPKSPMTSSIGILRSPFNSPSGNILSPGLGAFMRPSPSSPASFQSVHALEDDLDSPSQHHWNAIASPSPQVRAETAGEAPIPSQSPTTSQDSDIYVSDDDEEAVAATIEENADDHQSKNQPMDSTRSVEEVSRTPSSISSDSNANRCAEDVAVVPPAQELTSEEDFPSDEDIEEHDSYGHTGIWALEGESTSVYASNESQSPQEQVEVELQRQRNRSLVLPAGETSTLSWSEADVSSPKGSISSERSSAQPIVPSLPASPSGSDKQRWTLEYDGGELPTFPGDSTIEAIDYPSASCPPSPVPRATEATPLQRMDYLSASRPGSPSPTSRATTFGIVVPEKDEGQDLTVNSNANATVGTIDYLDANLSPDLDDSFDTPVVPFPQQEQPDDLESPNGSPEYTGDSTAYLGYLQVDPPEGDTLNSFYNVYTDAPSSSQVATAISDPSTTPSSSLRERVFTPPPDKTPRCGRDSAQTPPPVPSSPPTSFGSLSKGRNTPSDIQQVGDRPESRQSQEASSSKRIPFGFRANRSSLRLSLSSSTSKNRNLLHLATSNLTSTEDLHQSPPTPPSSAGSGGPALRPLRLSVLLQSHTNAHANSHSSTAPSTVTSFAINDRSHHAHDSTSSHPSLLATNSLSTPRSAPHHVTFTGLIESTRSPSIFTEASQLTEDFNHLANFGSPLSAPISAPPQYPSHHPAVYLHDEGRPSSRLSEPIHEEEEEDGEDTTEQHDLRNETIRRPLDPPPHSAPVMPVTPVVQPPAPQTPMSAPRQSTFVPEIKKPKLMFAIASDDVEQVRNVLESGEADPNECVGPQAALAFALANDNLTNKLEIVKTLLAFGADPSVLKEDQPAPSADGEPREDQTAQVPSQNAMMEAMDPATRYYVERATAAQTRRTSKLINRSFFRPLARVQYDLIGQDRALEELFRLLSIHSRQTTVSPLVVMFSGPSGHGKSLLARKFGSLLDIPTHTVNMVTPRSQDDLWESYSVSPIEEPTNCTLAEFLVNNEGKRCVVVLDEIEKVVNEKILWSLLMPWEHGRCSFEARSRHIDVRKVIWLCTSNIGQDLIFNHWDSREDGQEVMTRQEFLYLVALLRPLVSERLGASVLSRITSVLPFVPFSLEEKRAMSAEAVFQLGGEDALGLSAADIESLIQLALSHFIPEEGARSLHRAISNHIVDMI